VLKPKAGPMAGFVVAERVDGREFTEGRSGRGAADRPARGFPECPRTLKQHAA
jgi:hypothetical protein